LRFILLLLSGFGRPVVEWVSIDTSVLQMKALSSKTLVPSYQTAQRHSQKDENMNFNGCRNWGLDEKYLAYLMRRKMTEDGSGRGIF
jgi:hypothetical protein